VRQYSLGLGLGLALGASSAQAQGTSAPLPITATLLFNALLYETPVGLEGGPLLTGRFAGRVGVRITPRSFAGFAVGSWQLGDAHCVRAGCDGGRESFVTVNREAVVLQLYGQVYPTRRLPLFVRAGAGIGHTYTLKPDGAFGLYMVGRTNQYLVASLGGGLDLRLARHLYLTPSLDYTTMLGVEATSDDLRSALAMGVGLTVR
jgi:hypothetical protein